MKMFSCTSEILWEHAWPKWLHPGALCVVVLWLFWGFALFKSAHLSLTTSKDPHRPPTYTHTHTPTYRMARLQSTGKPSATEAQLHTDIGIQLAFTGTRLFRATSFSFSLTHTHLIQGEQTEAICYSFSVKQVVCVKSWKLCCQDHWLNIKWSVDCSRSDAVSVIIPLVALETCIHDVY